MLSIIHLNMLEQYQEIDGLVFKVAALTDPLNYVNPINEEKEAFLSGRLKDPKFKYKRAEYDIGEVDLLLSGTRIPQGPLHEIYLDKISELTYENLIIEGLGSRIVRSYSKAIYGDVTTELTNEADRILNEIPYESLELIHDANFLKEAFERFFELEQFEWDIEICGNGVCRNDPINKKIIIPTRQFPDESMYRLPLHEGSHAMGTANGFLQDLKIFAIGLPGYESTEEGKSLYLEHLAGVLSEF